jgi:hypothetical protein
MTGTPRFLVGTNISGQLTVSNIVVGARPFGEFRSVLEAASQRR